MNIRRKKAPFLAHLAVLWFRTKMTAAESNTCTDAASGKLVVYKKDLSKSCQWLRDIASQRKKQYCTDESVSNAKDVCPDVCDGKCLCNDSADDEFTDIFGVKRECEWLTKEKVYYKGRQKYCAQTEAAVQTCPDTCSGWCNTRDDFTPDVVSLPECQDDDSFRYDNWRWKHCNWVGQWKGLRCKGFGVAEACPLTCGTCVTAVPTSPPDEVMECSDDVEFMIDNKKWKNCEWVATWRKKRCAMSGVLEACPLTCGTCLARTSYPTLTPPSPMPTPSPSQFPFDIHGCYDSMGRARQGQQEVMSSREWWNNTRWIDSGRHQWFHKRLLYAPIVGDTTLIAGVLFTVSKRKLKMSVLFPPLYPNESDVATITIKGDSNGSVRTRDCSITPHIWHCLFEIDVNKDQSYSYRVRYHPDVDNEFPTYIYDGVIPKPEKYPRVVALGCLGNDNTMNKTELVDAVLATSPNMIVLTGDQTYKHWNLGFGFLETIYTMNGITRSIPTLVMMDDHDYGQGSLKGAGDKQEDSGAGFERPACLNNFMEELMMSHNPDPARTSTLQNGMSPKYTTYMHGQLDFALTEARKFKTFSSDPRKDSILGKEQEEWLKEWCAQDTDKVKVVLAGTPFANLVTHMTAKIKGFVTEGNNDRDSNGAPLSGRIRVMDILNGCSPLVISGDQHLGIVATYDKYGVSECVSPAVLNSIFWRLNYNTPAASYNDSFGNQYTLQNVWNVHDNVTSTYGWARDTVEEDKQVKNDRGDGFLTVDFDGTHAVCGMHEYWFGQNLKWEEKVPATPQMIVE